MVVLIALLGSCLLWMGTTAPAQPGHHRGHDDTESEDSLDPPLAPPEEDDHNF